VSGCGRRLPAPLFQAALSGGLVGLVGLVGRRGGRRGLLPVNFPFSRGLFRRRTCRSLGGTPGANRPRRGGVRRQTTGFPGRLRFRGHGGESRGERAGNCDRATTAWQEGLGLRDAAGAGRPAGGRTLTPGQDGGSGCRPCDSPGPRVPNTPHGAVSPRPHGRRRTRVLPERRGCDPGSGAAGESRTVHARNESRRTLHRREWCGNDPRQEVSR